MRVTTYEGYDVHGVEFFDLENSEIKKGLVSDYFNNYVRRANVIVLHHTTSITPELKEKMSTLKGIIDIAVFNISSDKFELYVIPTNKKTVFTNE
ncbi:hypothetical protein [Nonlabens sp.]|uniref:hypothetical protein n=1 Tax=Nonlabens sp. TaxID=1888209 RepID=UPI0025F541CF|nr:hypothetical protein [Nonlabens sp.]